MTVEKRISRRNFMAGAAVSAAALGLADVQVVLGQAAPTKRYKVIGFSKPFQKFSFEETAETAAEIGWDGIECPVRAKGQILPEHVEDELPKMAESLRRRKLELSIIATDIQDATNPLSERVLRTAGKLGVQRYRLGFFKYPAGEAIPDRLKTIHAQLRDLAALNRELGMCAGFQNHSGADYVGAPVWDIHEAIRGLDPKHIGIFFDLGHATLEGGYSWPIQSRLMQPWLSAVYLKDFVWRKAAAGWEAKWCPLGEGTVHREFFQTLKQSSFSGPICQHHEYEVGDRDQMIKAMKKDLRVLSEWLTT